jgi:hypothetical protein
MASPSERLVPKVHPATRPVEPDDPFTLYAIPVPGDPEIMLDCLVQEYANMGWGVEQIVGLCRDPFYPALYRLWQLWGAERIQELVAERLRQSGASRFQVVIHEESSPAEPELFSLGILPPHEERQQLQRQEGSNHG